MFRPVAVLVMTVAMVMMTYPASGNNFLTEKRRYCGRKLVGSLLKACGIGVFSRDVLDPEVETTDTDKRDSNDLGDQSDNTGYNRLEALLALYFRGQPLSVGEQVRSGPVWISPQSTGNDGPVRRNMRLLPTHFLLEKCCQIGCSLLDMVGICN